MKIWRCIFENLETLVPKSKPSQEGSGKRVTGHCLCGAVALEITFPAFWAWHDHAAASRRAHGAAYATYIGCWRKNVRIAGGEASVASYRDGGSTRSFCARCGSPLIYERKSSRHMINIPRALFAGRIGREPRYHLNIAEQVDWLFTGAPLVPLKGYPGVMWERPKSRRRPQAGELDAAFEQAFRNTPAPPSRKPPRS
jgi:hypothetical protein